MSRRRNVSTSKSPALKRRRQTVSAPKHLVAKNFQCQYISAQKSCTARSPYGEVCSRRNVPTVQCLTAIFLMAKSPLPKFSTPKKSHSENSLRQTVLTTKCTYGSVSQRRKILTAKCPMAKFFYGEMSYGKFSDSKKSHGKNSLRRCNHGEMYLRLSVLAAKSPYGKVSRGELFYGEMSHGKISGHVQTHRQLQHQAERRGLNCNLWPVKTIVLCCNTE